MRQGEVLFERMRPGELEGLVRERPLAWLPVGTLEWHGRHLPVGLDAIKAHELCRRAAQRAGGAVLPLNYLTSMGMVFPWTFRHAPGALLSAVDTVLRRLRDHGFRAMIVITGHYPMAQVAALAAAAEVFMLTGNAAAAAAPEFAFAMDKGYHGDHAAKWETSIMMELFPELVDESELGRLRGMNFFSLASKGVQGKNPAEAASRAVGAEIVEAIVSNMASLAEELMEEGAPAARAFHRRFAAQYLRTLLPDGIINRFRSGD